MTINLADNTPRVEYSVAQGVVQTTFAVPFEFFDNGDLTVYVDGVEKTEGSDYTVTGGDGSTGQITMSVTGGTGGSTVVLVRDIAIERTTDFTSNAINRAALNTQLDTIIGMIADLDDKASRTLQISDYEVAANISLPSIEDRSGRVIAFDENGNTIAGPIVDEIFNAEDYATQSAASAAAATLLAAAAATSETNAEVSENAAAASASAALISENAAAASQVAASTSEVNAATSETNAAASETSAATSETNAANSATASAASASSASTSATNAATSETNAAGSATAAAASQVAAAASAASAANNYDLFDDRYLGSKTSDPTLDNDGNALVAGALYFNSTANEMRVYDGANWIAASSAGGASLLNYNYTATAGQTTFSGADDNAATLSYTQQNLIVTLNGIVLEDGTDYTASNGTSIVLTTAAAAGDELNIVAFKSFTTADMVPASTGGTFSGNVAVDGNLVVDTDTLFVDSTNNRVGFGTTSPFDAIHVEGTIRGNVSDATDENIRLTTTGGGGFVVDVDDATVANPTWSIRTFSSEPLSFEIGGAERMRIDSSGNVLVGTTDDAVGVNDTNTGLSLRGVGQFFASSNSTPAWFNLNANGTLISARRSGVNVGSITVTTSSTSYNTSSDYRLKEDVQPMVGASDRVLALNPVNFAWKASGIRVDGFIAHEAQAVVPEAVHGTKDEVDEDGNPVYQGIDQSKLVPLLTAALQEAIGRIETLEAEVAALKGATNV